MSRGFVFGTWNRQTFWRRGGGLPCIGKAAKPCLVCCAYVAVSMGEAAKPQSLLFLWRRRVYGESCKTSLVLLRLAMRKSVSVSLCAGVAGMLDFSISMVLLQSMPWRFLQIAIGQATKRQDVPSHAEQNFLVVVCCIHQAVHKSWCPSAAPKQRPMPAVQVLQRDCSLQGLSRGWLEAKLSSCCHPSDDRQLWC